MGKMINFMIYLNEYLFLIYRTLTVFRLLFKK
jgi:hypothetical protein